MAGPRRDDDVTLPPGPPVSTSSAPGATRANAVPASQQQTILHEVPDEETHTALVDLDEEATQVAEDVRAPPHPSPSSPPSLPSPPVLLAPAASARGLPSVIDDQTRENPLPPEFVTQPPGPRAAPPVPPTTLSPVESRTEALQLPERAGPPAAAPVQATTLIPVEQKTEALSVPLRPGRPAGAPPPSVLDPRQGPGPNAGRAAAGPSSKIFVRLETFTGLFAYTRGAPRWVVAVAGTVLAVALLVGAWISTHRRELPELNNLRQAYPYGYEGATGPFGEKVPGASAVEFRFVEARPCSEGSFEECVVYEFSWSGRPAGTMLLKKTARGWVRASDEGMPFRLAR